MLHVIGLVFRRMRREDYICFLVGFLETACFHCTSRLSSRGLHRDQKVRINAVRDVLSTMHLDLTNKFPAIESNLYYTIISAIVASV